MPQITISNQHLTWKQVKRGVVLVTTHHNRQTCWIISEVSSDVAYGFVFGTPITMKLDLPLLQDQISRAEIGALSRTKVKLLSPRWLQLSPDQYRILIQKGLVKNLQREFRVAQPLNDFNQMRLLNFLAGL